jgi:galactosylceramidase
VLFRSQPPLSLHGNTVELELEPNAIYTFTSTTGQQKGSHGTPPPRKPFPFPFEEDFESYHSGDTPRYFSDQKGTFEVWEEPGHGKCLKQIVPQQGILWQYMTSVIKPYTVIGDQKWSDYTLAADVRVVDGDVEVGGRFGDQNKLSYRWILAKDGSWKLNYQDKPLASGAIKDFNAGAWHAMKIEFHGAVIRGYIDGQLLARVQEATRSNGMAYLASTYHGNLFDNVSISAAAITKQSGER